MSKSRMFLACALAAFALASAAVQTISHAFVDTVIATGRAFKNLVLDGFKLAANTEADKAGTARPFVQARAFVLRMIKRERPVKTSQWNHCPST